MEELDLVIKEPPVIDLVGHTYQTTWGGRLSLLGARWIACVTF